VANDIIITPQQEVLITITPPVASSPTSQPPIVIGPGQGGSIGTQGTQGLTGAGIQGTQGLQGLQGIAGNFASPPIAYTHMQMGVSDIWVIPHNLGFYPNVTVIDSGGSTVEGEVVYTSINSLTLIFTAGFSGTAYVS
jgi:hypothetical protein